MQRPEKHTVYKGLEASREYTKRYSWWEIPSLCFPGQYLQLLCRNSNTKREFCNKEFWLFGTRAVEFLSTITNSFIC